MGFDQWFRLFLPVADDSLERLPATMSTLSYLKFLTVAKASRPIMRSYTVRAWRDTGEIDVDFVLHEPAGRATSWATTCSPGDPVALLDEGVGFNPPASLRRVRLAGDESALPAIAGGLASLPVGDEPFYGWVAGEQALATGLRRHWVGAGVPKQHIMFCGYWRAG
jgi:NADPH-dependent ferric siderophore reductase